MVTRDADDKNEPRPMEVYVWQSWDEINGMLGRKGAAQVLQMTPKSLRLRPEGAPLRGSCQVRQGAET